MITSTLNKVSVSEQKPKFPLLAQSLVFSECTVCFTSEHCGIVVKAGYSPLMKMSDGWTSCFDKSCWRILEKGESVTLTQE
jgi:hypothetical protein